MKKILLGSIISLLLSGCQGITYTASGIGDAAPFQPRADGIAVVADSSTSISGLHLAYAASYAPDGAAKGGSLGPGRAIFHGPVLDVFSADSGNGYFALLDTELMNMSAHPEYRRASVLFDSQITLGSWFDTDMAYLTDNPYVFHLESLLPRSV